MSITYINRLTLALQITSFMSKLMIPLRPPLPLAMYLLKLQISQLLTRVVCTLDVNDCIMLSASDGISWCSINSTFTTLALGAFVTRC